jgi:hypothetical protein
MTAWALLLLACPAPQAKVANGGKDTMTEPRRVSLVQDTPVELAPGVSVVLKAVLDAHATDKAGRSVNDVMMRLDVTRDGKVEQVTLQRLFPDGPVYEDVAGLRLAIDYADAYHQPSTGAVLVLPASPR